MARLNKKLDAVLEILLIVFLFLALAYLVQTRLDFFQKFLGKNLLGFFVYTVIVIISIVIAPISAIPLLPVVSKIWGWPTAAAVSVVGWTSGSIIVFFISRRYGVKIVKRLVNLESIYRYENKIPRENLFLTVLFLRMIIPVDVLSYALGLFSKMKFWPYTIATFLGVIPSTIIFAYVGGIPFIYQVITILSAGIIIIIFFIIRHGIKRKNQK